MSNFMKIRPVDSRVLHADGRTDGQAGMTKLLVSFRTFFCSYLHNMQPHPRTVHGDVF